mmetsp:Transcript_28824/g.73862  ORF Transcript_28824/g.73862 Transcript_28824/m.73862 type:complete len:425 (-) Transcript_28824:612-1886(-)
MRQEKRGKQQRMLSCTNEDGKAEDQIPKQDPQPYWAAVLPVVVITVAVAVPPVSVGRHGSRDTDRAGRRPAGRARRVVGGGHAVAVMVLRTVFMLVTIMLIFIMIITSLGESAMRRGQTAVVLRLDVDETPCLLACHSRTHGRVGRGGKRHATVVMVLATVSQHFLHHFATHRVHAVKGRGGKTTIAIIHLATLVSCSWCTCTTSNRGNVSRSSIGLFRGEASSRAVAVTAVVVTWPVRVEVSTERPNYADKQKHGGEDGDDGEEHVDPSRHFQKRDGGGEIVWVAPPPSPVVHVRLRTRPSDGSDHTSDKREDTKKANDGRHDRKAEHGRAGAVNLVHLHFLVSRQRRGLRGGRGEGARRHHDHRPTRHTPVHLVGREEHDLLHTIMIGLRRHLVHNLILCRSTMLLLLLLLLLLLGVGGGTD